MELNIKYSNTQLEKIREQGFIYMCACPSQVAEQVVHLRNLSAYQHKCMTLGETALEIETHKLIAKATHQAHDIMQDCLHNVLIYEKWNLETLEMPTNLRQLLEKTLLE